MKSNFYTPSQVDTLSKLPKWFNGKNPISIIEAPAGFGKTFIIKAFLDNMGRRVKPLILAETNEAVNVLKHNLGSKYIVKTVCSAFNLVLGNVEGVKQILQHNQPDFDKVNLLVVDECSILSRDRILLILNTCIELGISILFIGHSSQLPPIEERDRDCISPAFLDDFYESNKFPIPEKFYLTEPVRNTTEIYAFASSVEELLRKRGVIASKFTVTSKFFTDYLISTHGTFQFEVGETVILAYTNARVAQLNTIVRKCLFGIAADYNTFLVKDRLLFRQPARCFSKPLTGLHKSMEGILKEKHIAFTTNTKAIVKSISHKDILGITCWELMVVSNHFEEGSRVGYVYYPLERAEVCELYHRLNNYAIWDKGVTRQKKFDIAHAVGSVFGVDARDEKHDLRYGYAMTCDQSQGSTIPNVFVDDGDINRYIKHRTLALKIKYTAYSRARYNLWRLQ